MCGRFTLSAKAEEIQRRFSARFTDGVYAPRYNIAPSQKVWTVTQDEPENLVTMAWGMKPSWWAEVSRQLINIRAETLESKTTFKRLLSSKRCLIPADGFYEWQSIGKQKQPNFIGLKDRALFSFAGLWDLENGNPHLAIITTVPNALVKRIHDRMPVILSKEHESEWLDGKSDPQSILKILKAYPAILMKEYKVSSMVNSPVFDGPECLAPIGLK